MGGLIFWMGREENGVSYTRILYCLGLMYVVFFDSVCLSRGSTARGKGYLKNWNQRGGVDMMNGVACWVQAVPVDVERHDNCRDTASDR
jgi:hypothetical protein